MRTLSIFASVIILCISLSGCGNKPVELEMPATTDTSAANG